jgi:glyceraldehyde-3-phosphate dehydrogenase (NADP+)
VGALSFNGQRCAAIKIIFAPRSIAETFLDRLSEALSALKCGMPWEEDAFITPLVEPGKPEYLKGLIDDARSLGARVVNSGGGDICGPLFRPAVLYPVNRSMRVCREEQFGPVVPVAPYDHIDEALQYMRESDYGQQASIFGRDKDRVARLASLLVHHVSRVNINCQCQRSPDMAPFTGERTLGREASPSRTQPPFSAYPIFVSARDTAANREIVEAASEENGRKRPLT